MDFLKIIIIFKLFIYLFIYLWLCWVFVSARGLSPVVASGGHSSSQCAGLSLSRPLVAEHRRQTRRLSSRGSRAQLLRGMRDPPRPGLEPVSPALAGRLSTTAPPGKPLIVDFNLRFLVEVFSFLFAIIFPRCEMPIYIFCPFFYWAILFLQIDL